MTRRLAFDDVPDDAALQQMVQTTIGNALARNSRDSLDGNYERYTRFATTLNKDRDDLETILAFLKYMAHTKNRTYSTIKCYLAAIRDHLRRSGQDDYVHNYRMVSFLAGLSREKGGLSFPNRKRPFTISQLDQMIAQCNTNVLHGERTKAMLCLAWGMLARVSELVELKRQDVKIYMDGPEPYLTVFVSHSKTDVHSRGTLMTLYQNTTPHDPVSPMASWIVKIPTDECPLFPTTSGNRFRVPFTATSKDTFRVTVKNLAEAIRLNPKDYGTHSIRHGAAHDAALRKVPPLAIKVQGRWVTMSMVAHYTDLTQDEAARQFQESINQS